MTLSSTITSETLIGDGVNHNWPFSFRCWEQEVRVVITLPDDSTEDVTALSRVILNDTDYDSGFEPGGVVIYPIADDWPTLPKGHKITILRDMNMLQELDLVEGERFLAENIEAEFDREVAMIQQLKAVTDRAILVPIGSDKTADELLDELLDASRHADRAEAAADRAEAAANETFLESGVYNVRTVGTLSNSIKAGALVTLPNSAVYYPTRNVLYLAYEGVICSPKGAGLSQGFVYEEVGTDPNVLSRQIRVWFDAEQGSIMDVWVVTSALGKNLDAMEVIKDSISGAVDAADADAKLARQEANRAKDEADRAEGAADLAALASGVHNTRAAFTVTSAIASGSTITLPVSYFPTRNVLYLSYDGVVCVPSKIGIASAYAYEEVGTDPNIPSNKIRILFNAEIGSTFDIWVVTSALGKNLDAMEAIKDQTEAIKDEVWGSVEAAVAEVTKAKDEVARATVEADRAEEQVGKAADEVAKASAEANRAETAADGAEATKDIIAGWIAEGLPPGTHAATHDPITGNDPLPTIKIINHTLTIYVREFGSDDADGLTAVTAKASLYGAAKEATKYAIVGVEYPFVTFDVDGTVPLNPLTKGTAYLTPINSAGSNRIRIVGSGVSTSKLSNTYDAGTLVAGILTVVDGLRLEVSNIAIQSPVRAVGNGTFLRLDGDIDLGENEDGSRSSSLVYAQENAKVSFAGCSLSVLGTAPRGLMRAESGGEINVDSSSKINFLVPQAYSYGVFSTVGGSIQIEGTPFSDNTNVVTGRKYYLVRAGDSLKAIPSTVANLVGTEDGTTSETAGVLNHGLVGTNSANGYQKLPNGVLIQWGLASFSTTSVTVTFPIAFAATPTLGIGSDNVSAGQTIYQIGFDTSSSSATKGVFRSTGTPSSFSWMAIGKWM